MEQFEADCIMIALLFDSKQESDKTVMGPRYRYMLWDSVSLKNFDFLSELKKKLKIKNLEDYDITTSEARLDDQEDIYGAIINHLKEDQGEGESMDIIIRKKT